MASNLSFSDRVSKAAEVLSIDSSDLKKFLEDSGLKNEQMTIQLFEADITTLDDIMNILEDVGKYQRGSVLENLGNYQINKLQLKAAAFILKGINPFEKEKMDITRAGEEKPDFVEIIKAIRPIQQWNDRELLEKYAKDRDYEIEQELHKRARAQSFIILSPGKDPQNREIIDINTSLELLKSARKRTNPSILNSISGKIMPVYRITELNPEDRIIELCPICSESLYKGFCEDCNINVSMIGDDERAYMYLIAKTEKHIGVSDKKAIIVSASKGIEDLKNTWPSLAKGFDELKLTNNLPRLRVVANRPSQTDPFFQDGNRAFGNRTF